MAINKSRSRKPIILIGPIRFLEHGGRYAKKAGPNGEPIKRPLIFKSIKDKYLGQIYKTRRGSLVQVIDFQDKFHVTVKFLDETGYVTVANIDNVKVGAVNNPYWTNAYGGYFGEGPYDTIGQMMTKVHKTWSCMLRRANVHLEDRRAYDNTAVCEEWLCYQNFADWYVKYMALINPKYYNVLEIDKDILQWNHKFKIYSPATCCLVPHDINIKLNGVYNSRNEGREAPIGTYRSKYNRYVAQITKNGKRITLGSFGTPEEAFEVYRKAKKEDIVEMATYFYNDGAITTDIYNALLSLEILPSQEDLI